jgi:hypothetical protein
MDARTRPLTTLAGVLAALALLPAAAQAAGQVQAGAAVVDGTYHVGNSAGQYASTRDGGVGDVDPHAEQVKNQASYGVQSRESVRALVVKGSDGQYVALVSDDHYIPQDALWRRTAQILDADTKGVINKTNLTMSVTHNHSSPSYSSLDWGVWAFQDVFDFRFFDYYAHQNAKAIEQALDNMKDVRVSATVSRFDAFQKNPMGPQWADDGTPIGFPRSHTDHDLSVVYFEGLEDHEAVGTLVNIGQHPEDLEGYDLISGEYPAETERFVDRVIGGVTILTQNATGTSEVEEDRWHPIHDREIFNHAQYTQMEWGARQLADSVIADVRSIRKQKPNPDDRPLPYGGTSYHDRFVRWMSKFPVAMQDRWFGGPVSHPYPGVSSCRTDAALQGNPRLPVIGLPDCTEVPIGSSLSPVMSQVPGFPGLSTDTFESMGIPIPENYSAPSHGALEDTYGVHMQAFRLGDILFTVCSCEQWVEQSYNIKTRTDTKAGNEYLGYDPTSPNAIDDEKCVQNADKTWKCTLIDRPGGPQTKDKIPDDLMQRLRAQINNDAAGWDDPNCQELGCGYQAESEPTDLKKIRGNFTHDDTGANADHGYKLTVTIAMANDYNGYIASYRDYMAHDHYRKALTGWGSHSSDYYATRLSQMGRALNGDGGALATLDGQTDPAKADPAWAPMIAKEQVDQAAEDAKVQAVGESTSAAVQIYDASLPDDGGNDHELVEPKDIQRFDSATFSWDGGNNYTDDPVVKVQRQEKGGKWVTFADQSGEIPVTLKYPANAGCTKPVDVVTGVYGGDPTNLDPPSPDPSKVDPACIAADGQAVAEGMVGYRAGGQVWKWTATFEAFVSWFPLVDLDGDTYSATPKGTYRFVVAGKWRKGGTTVPYTRVSKPFDVKPWTGITVENARVGPAGHVAFSAGPSHTITEDRVRSTARPPIADHTWTIGPVDFPDVAKDQKATGARFLNSKRGYSGTSHDEVEHYCLDCTFRPWLDATGDLEATLVIKRARGGTVHEHLTPDAEGDFVSKSTLAAGDKATIEIEDAWGNSTDGPTNVSA